MVQKKVPNKLGNLQADQVKSHKLKPSSFQHQESKNRGIMKKYRENLSSPSFRKQVPQPGKPPPPISPSKMQSLTKTSDKKPNYMKPTSCSDARKENSQTNFKNLQTSKKNGKSPSSEKLVRTLTKTTSFKPARTANKKNHPIVQKESLDVQRATCSSTLKDSKFPDYLTLNSRGTEAEGTSIIKVCPYTYCSLNGHHHLPLPPLKSFLSAKRHMMKTQRSLKLGCISPNRSRLNRDAMEEIELLQLSFQEKLSDEEDDFFIQIFSNEREAGDKDETEEVLESPLPEINYQETCHGNSDTIYSDTDAADYSSEDNQNENADVEAFSPFDSELEMEDDEVNSIRSIVADVEASSPFDSELEMEGYPTLYLEESITKPDEIERNYLEELKLGEMMGESIEKKNIMGSDADCDQDFKIDKAIKNSGMQSDDEIDDLAQKVDIFMYDDEIDNTNFMSIEVVDASIPPSKMDLENFNIAADFRNEEEFPLSEELISFCDSSNAVEDMSPRYYIENNEDVLKEEENQELQEANTIENLNDLEKNDAAIASMMECSDSQAESDARVQVSTDIGEESCPESDARVQVSTDIGEESCPAAKSKHTIDTKDAIEKRIIDLDIDKDSKKGKWIYDRKESVLEQNESNEFNPRAPNYLQLEPGPEAEKVDLKHQMIDDRRNSEEWMLDYALQQAVTKLAAARKKKVTLLVEAFETVSPLPKWEKQFKRPSAGFDHQQRIQACG